MDTILNTIADYAKIRVQQSKQLVSYDDIKSMALSMNCDTGFPFEKALAKGDISFICECKKASPSKGLIAPELSLIHI